MQAERDAAIARAEALQEHVTELLSGQACACGYDSPYDVCLGHLPLYRKTVARAEAAEARVAELEALLDRDLADALKGRPATVALGIHPGGDELNYYRSRANSLQIAMDRQIRIADDYRKEGVAYRRKSESAADQAAIREVKLREKLAASQDRVSELEGALHLTSDQALTAEIPEGYGPDQRAEWGAGYDAAIANSRAALAQPTDQASFQFSDDDIAARQSLQNRMRNNTTPHGLLRLTDPECAAALEASEGQILGWVHDEKDDGWIIIEAPTWHFDGIYCLAPPTDQAEVK
jgi:hypothetical protein